MSIATDLAATAFGQFVADDITAIDVDGHGDLRVPLRPIDVRKAWRRTLPNPTRGNSRATDGYVYTTAPSGL